MNIDEKVRKIISGILGVEGKVIEEDTAVGDIDDWDSLNHLKIITAIEEEFNIQFTPDVLMDIEDFSDIVHAVKERL